MKKLFILLSILGIFIASNCYAADVVITITIPDAYVARVAVAIERELRCPDGMGPKACLKAHIINDIKALVKGYESKINQETFNVDYIDPSID